MKDTIYERHVISFRNAVIAAIIIVIIYAAISILLRDSKDIRGDVLNIVTIIIDILATICLAYGAYTSRKHKNILIAWAFLAAARFSFTIGDIIWAILESVLHQPFFPSYADPFYLVFYILFALGIMIFPRSPMNSTEKLKVFLDIGIVMIASIIIFWILLIAPTIESNAGTNALTSALAVAYPVADLVLFFALIETLFRGFESTVLRPTILLIASMFFMILTDFVFLKQQLNGTFDPSGLVAVGWISAYLLSGLAGISQADLKKLDLSSAVVKTKTTQFKWPIYIPYFCQILSFFILIWFYNHLLPISFTALSLAVGGIVVLVVIRQVVALNENVRLYYDKVHEIDQRKKAEEEVRRLNEALESRVSERTAQLESANRELTTEILEHKKSDEALQDSQRLMSNIIDFLPDAIMALDLDGKVMIWNKAMEALTRVRSEDILGKSNYEHAVPFYGFRRPILIDMVLKPHEGWETEYFGFQRDGDAVVGEAFIPTFSPHGSYLLGKATRLYNATGKLIGVIESIRDMTDRRKMEQRLERTKAELGIAADIQKSFIPEHTPDIPGIDISAVTLPAMEVGGDFYDFIKLNDGKYGLVIADVAGKSISAAIFMALSRTIIRANAVNQEKISDVLASANKMIESDAPVGMFVTLLYGVINRNGLSFIYSNAGHLPPLIFRSEKCTSEKGNVMGIALGAAKDANYSEKVIELSPGDIVALYTDGVTEAVNNNGEMYGEKRLVDVIGNHCKEKAKDIIDLVLENIKSFTEEEEQQDDLTLMILKAVVQAEMIGQIRVIAHENEVPGIVDNIEGAMRDLGFSDEDIFGFQLAVEEACINIINHGYRKAHGYISIILESTLNCFMVTIEDEAPPFDPTRFEKPTSVINVNEVPLGGFGIHLIKSLTDEIRYDYAEGKNRLILMKRRAK